MTRDDSPGWVTAADVADYAFCPRSHWYRHHPPPEGPTAQARRRSAAGERFHTAELRATDRRSRHGASYWVWVVVGGLLVLGGVAWLLH